MQHSDLRPRPAALPLGLAALPGEPIPALWLLLLAGVLLLVAAARAVAERRRRGTGPLDASRLVFPLDGAPSAGSPAPPRPSPSPPRARPAAPPSFPVAPRPEPDVGSETIRMERGLDGTVQLLPGRLVVVEGAEPGREYRFLRESGQAAPEVTVGRAPGAAGTHVQLAAPTVSRLHARLRFRDGRWSIANESATNPARVNGRAIDPGAASALSDGDRIEMGEVVLRFLESRP